MQPHTFSSKLLVLLPALFLMMAASRLAAADTLTLVWDANSESALAGYVVHSGTQPGTYSQHTDVGLTTGFVFQNAVPGQRYCFAVSAYVAGPLEGLKSTEVCGFSDTTPTLVNPGAQTSIVSQATTLQLQAADPDGLPVTYAATGLPTGLTLMASTGFISGTPTTAGGYTVTATVSDGVLASSQTFNWTIGTSGATSAAVVTIIGPTSADTYSTNGSTVTLNGTASGSGGVTQVRWVTNHGGSGTASGTTSWTAPGIDLPGGMNIITITATDAAGNTATDVLAVTVTLWAGDGTAPTVTIAAPTSSTAFTTSAATVSLGGTAGDNIAVAQVSWTNNRGGSGIASGTASWSVASIALQAGANIVTVTATDAAGNTATDVLTVTQTVTTVDTTAPTVVIAAPTASAAYTTTAGAVALSGAAADNLAIAQVRWASNRGGNGIASGTASWSVTSIALQAGDNIVTVTATDAAGNIATDVVTVTQTAIVESLGCWLNGGEYAKLDIVSITKKTGSIESWLRTYAQGWKILSRGKSRGMTTVYIQCI